MGTKHFYQYVMSASSTAAYASSTEFGNTKAAQVDNSIIWVGDDGQQAILTVDVFDDVNEKQTGSVTSSSGGFEIWLDKKGFIWP